MNLTEEHIELFDRFLRNEMNEQEKADFLSRLENDKEFKDAFDSFKLLEDAFEDAEIIAFKDQLKDWDKQEEPAKPKGRVIRLMAVAASIIILVGLSIPFFLNGDSPQKMAENYFSPYENVVTIRGDKEAIDEGMLLYEEGKYSEAIPIFVSCSDNVTAYFYLGECHMAMKDYIKAIDVFEAVRIESDLLKDIATYHLALAYLGNGNKEKATEVLTEISTDSDYHQEALRILEDLK